MATQRAANPYASGYEHGTLTAVNYVDSIRSQVTGGASVSPSDLAQVLATLMKKLEAHGGWAIAEQPVAEHSPEQQAILGEFFGFCAGLMEAF